MARYNPGVFTVSLDFELHWGMRDIAPAAELAPRFLTTRQTIPRTLRMFEEFGVHATWATVGVLFCEDGDEVRALAPPEPAYRRPELSPWPEFETLGADDPCRLAPRLIDAIAATPGQEVGTHTFSHFYCLEDGTTTADFERDIDAANAVADRRGHPVRSIVFPRNQYAQAHIDAAAARGVDVHRGNPTDWMYRPRAGSEQTPWVRAARLVDAYAPLSGRQTVPLASLPTQAPFNVPATRFLRPYMPATARAERLRILRITDEILYAAKHGHLMHLWWHPHNFGAHADENFAALRQVLSAFRTAERKYGMRALNMGEVADALAAE